MFDTYFICYLIVWACWFACFLHSRTSICCFDCLGFFGQVDVQECLSTFSSYLCFLVSNSILATSQKLNKSFSDPPGEEHSEPPIWKGWTSKTFYMISAEPIHSHSVQQKSYRLICFSFSVSPSWTFRSHRFAILLAVTHIGATELFHS